MILELFPDLDKKVTEGSKTAPYLRQSALLLKQNMFSKKILNKGNQVLDGIKKKAESLKQFNELSQVNRFQAPQDNHTQLSKKKLEDILRAAQKK